MKSPQLRFPLFRANMATLPCLVAVFLSVACTGIAEESAISSTNRAYVALLRPAVQVDGRGVFLSEVIETNFNVPRIRLGDSPAFGKSLLLKRAEVIALARAAGVDLPFTNLSGQEAVRISRRARLLGENETLQLLNSALQKEFVKDQGELELRLSRPWTSINIPDEAFAIKVLELPTTGVSPSFIVRFEIETGQGEHIGSWQASLQAKVWRQVWVAGSPFKRGDSIRAADVSRERRDMLVCREPLAEFTPDDPSLEFVEPVQAGAPILARVLRPRAIVHRGQTVAAMVRDGALMITLKVEALEDGAAGQFIRVRNPLSRRDLRGKVLDDQNISVSL